MSITLISFLWNVYCHVLHCTWLTYPSILRKWINCLINLRKSSWLDPNLDNYLGAPEIQFRLAISKRQLIHLLSNANNKCSQSFKFILVSKSSTQIHWYTYCHLGAYCSQNTFFTLNHECHILKIWCAKSFLFKVFFLKVAAIEKKTEATPVPSARGHTKGFQMTGVQNHGMFMQHCRGFKLFHYHYLVTKAKGPLWAIRELPPARSACTKQ